MGTDNLGREGSIAIIGMAGRFPGAGNIDEFWRNIENGVESITFFSEDELIREGVDPDRATHPKYVKAAAVLKGADLFDADFFEYSPREAEVMDPAQRIFLELAWEALEHAGYSGDSHRSSIGVFAGAGGLMNSYLVSNTHVHHDLIGATAGIEHVGNDKDYLCTRVSYKLNLKGPSLTIQTACSTSLVAVHVACQSLLNMECDVAIAGGVNIRVPQKAGYLVHECPMHSPDGHTRPFDARAKGTLFGSGAGIVVLKPLARAEADGDQIHAVIRGSTVNNDGSSKLSYWAASADGLAETLSEALAVAEVTPETVEYVEAHGTGTELGDPVEVHALTKVFRQGTQNRAFCALGSVKSNIGHLESASGVASLIKAVMALKHRTLPPTIHFSKPNPRINFNDGPFYVNSRKKEWKTTQENRRAIVNNLGIGGTNACVVLEAPPAQADRGQSEGIQVLTLSAKSRTTLKKLAQRFVAHLNRDEDRSFEDVCFTANTGRAHFNHRLALTAIDSAEARTRLTEFVETGGTKNLRVGKIPKDGKPEIAFLFAHGESDYFGMGRQFYDRQPVFREALDRCDTVLKNHFGQSPLDRIRPENGSPASSKDTPHAQPVLFALEYALAELWRSWGVEPKIVMGHGVGEYVAACVAGLFSLEDGLKLISAQAFFLKDPDRIDIMKTASAVTFSTPRIDLISSHSGENATAEMMRPEYWVDVNYGPAGFVSCKETCRRAGINLFLEIGPQADPSFRKDHDPLFSDNVWLPGFNVETDLLPQMLGNLKALYVQGVSLNWGGVYKGRVLRRVALPTYPFARKRHWISQSGTDPGGEKDDKEPIPPPNGRLTDSTAASAVSQTVFEKTGDYLCRVIGDLLKIEAREIDPDTNLKEYGVDSMLITRFNIRMEEQTGPLPKTLLFEYQTLNELTHYMVENHGNLFFFLLGMTEPDRTDAPESLSVIQPEGPERFPSRSFSKEGGQTSGEEIAIIGISGRYPSAGNMEEFWENLKTGEDCITEIPQARWDYRDYFDPDPQKSRDGKIYCKWGAFLEDADRFDPLLFNIPPKDAGLIDPQERLFLETAWCSLEDAGYTRGHLNANQVGVFVGITTNSYFLWGAERLRTGNQGFPKTLPWSIANRVSYCFNFNGPSIPVDTACSASLTAIHLACESLKKSECDLALAGGVNLYLHPYKYVQLCQDKMLSIKGRCHSFGADGDGFVPGEGVGALVLKPLRRAVEDQDQIYATIKGSAVNHGGNTIGYYVPNPKAQADLISKTLRNAGTNPETISYVEAHGTGTSLGDPVEIRGLTKAYREFTTKKQYCGIGSIKSNIGHLEAAAGIAGMTKIILQMKYSQLVPSLHARTLNPNIDFEDSPFYVQQELSEWKAQYPRRAAISSFGAGGSNAHVVIEEYQGKEFEVQNSKFKVEPQMIVLSAKNEDRLKAYAEVMIDYIAKMDKKEIRNPPDKRRTSPQSEIQNLAHTLQVGREAMEERLAFMAGTIKGLKEKLRGFLDKGGEAEGIYRGRAKPKKRMAAVSSGDRALSDISDQPINEADDESLLKSWVKGAAVDWNRRYDQTGSRKPGKISLPTYPFARDRYWLPEIELGGVETAAGSPSAEIAVSPLADPVLHPLLHQNRSDHTVQRFSSTFTGQEFFLRDHEVGGRRILPGVAYLEMVRTAVSAAMGSETPPKKGIRLKNVVWIRPLAVGDRSAQIHIRLSHESRNEFGFEVYSQPDTTDPTPVVYCQGRALAFSLLPPPPLDIDDLKGACNLRVFNTATCYEAFRAMGLDYGPGHQGIEKIYVGTDQALAKLSLPASVSHTLDQFVLHPSLMDSALQATVGFKAGSEQKLMSGTTPTLPFTLQELEVFGRCDSTMWARIRYHNSRADSSRDKLDIDVCDGEGRIQVSLKGFSSRRLEPETGSAEHPTSMGTLIVHPSPVEQSIIPKTGLPAYGRRVVFLCEFGDSIKESIDACDEQVRCLSLQPIPVNGDLPPVENRFQTYAVQIFEEIQNIIKDKPKAHVLIQVLVPLVGENNLFAGLSGLLKTARLENPKLIAQLIHVDSGEEAAGIQEKLNDNGRCPKDIEIRYSDGKRWIIDWKEIDAPRKESYIPWKDRGTYLITGGAGGLGLIIAEEIVRRVQHASIILTGRSILSGDKQGRLDELRAMGTGARIEYLPVDVTHPKVVEDLFRHIKKRFRGLNGIIHGAGVIRDNFILKKSTEEIVDVLGPKVVGLVNLDQASKALNLDFFILFSSISGSLGNPGQADYAMANAFMDAYAAYRNALVAQHRRHGHTLSVNWPLWRSGGMRVDEETEKIMRSSSGMIPMDSPTGIRSLYEAMASKEDQVMVLYGDLDHIRRLLFIKSSVPSKSERPISESDAGADMDIDLAIENIQTRLMNAVSEILDVKFEDIEADAEFIEYGFDSFTFTELANLLNQAYGLELIPTAFFEYPTLSGFAEFLIGEHRGHFVEMVSSRIRTDPSEKDTDYLLKHISSDEETARRSENLRVSMSVEDEPTGREPVAIVGISGRFPMAGDVNELWKNLSDGRDCIEEVPLSRWDWRDYFGDPVTEINKTNIKWGGFIKGIDEFDPLFFRISPGEAELMDPQQRLLMMYIWKALEDAGYSAQSLSGTKTAIFVGTAESGYSNLISQAHVAIESYSATGTTPSVGPNRMSHFLNLHGPSGPVETACSSSLVAIHRAIAAMERGECEMAIVGGVNTIITPQAHISFSKAGMLCEDGRCRTFSDRANGYVRGEGVGMLFLKKLRAAEQAGDHIYGVIRGSAENHGGRTASLTAPNPKAQAELLIAAYENAGIHPESIGYIEAHGTGTDLGDPIEIEGLKTAFSAWHQSDTIPEAEAHCGLGSIKTGIGHLELAAGVAGVIKVLLQLKYNTLVKSLHCDTLNPYIQLENSPFFVVREKQEWKPLKDTTGNILPRRAGVSSFGFGGVNAHVVIEEYVESRQSGISAALRQESGRQESESGIESHIIVLSAKNEDRLKAYAQSMLDYIANMDQKEIRNPPDKRRTSPQSAIRNLAYTLQVGRDHLEERLAVVTNSAEDLKDKLSGFLKNRHPGPDVFRGQVKRHKEALAIFSADEDLRFAIDAWVAKGKYSRLLSLWVKGMVFDWNRLHNSPGPMGSAGPRRVSLPTYPFAKERYWVPVTSQTIRPIPSKKAVPKLRPVSNPVSSKGTNSLTLQEKTQNRLKSLFATIAKLPTDAIHVEEPLENYGIDSIMINRLNQELAGIFGVLPKTLFFEYRTLEDLTVYLVEDHRQGTLKWTSMADSDPKGEDTPAQGFHLKAVKVSDDTLKTAPAVLSGFREPIAIIGTSGRFPQAETLDIFWRNLEKSKNSITAIPETRWMVDGFFHPDPEKAVSLGKSYSKWGGFLRGFAEFDPLFFDISPRQALSMDPQERLFLEESWRTFEDAGYTKERLAERHDHRVGVFVGITKTGFELCEPDMGKRTERILPWTSFSSVANRISYLMNLKGPSMPIDTMCSSSLTAIHEACEHLLRGECELALAGGVNLTLHPNSYIALCTQYMLSTDGRCKSFGRGGNGFVPGEGVGAVLLKPLSRAVADRDHIHGVIRGTGINHGGKTHGYTIPNPTAQAELIRNTMDRAGINARAISYIEAHGTGTELGDPIEIVGLTRAFGEDTQDTRFCAIGSVKSNIGHLEAAAGIAGVIKILLQLKNKKLVPSLHAQELNPNIQFEESPFVVQQNLSQWQRPKVEINGEIQEHPRIAGISSFGAGGSNAHVIIEEYEEPEFRSQESGVRIQEPESGIETHIIVLSAKNEDRLKAYAKVMIDYIAKLDKKEIRNPPDKRRTSPQSAIRNLAFTLQAGREEMEFRLAVISDSLKVLSEKLKRFLRGKDADGVYFGKVEIGRGVRPAFAADEDTDELVHRWIEKRKLDKIADIWVRGFKIDWSNFYDAEKPLTVSLPTYPFLKEKYWFNETGINRPYISGTELNGPVDDAQALLGENVSTLNGFKFRKIFSGEEHVLRDHAVHGKKTLPGVAYLEWARSAGEVIGGHAVERMEDIVWITPLSFDDDLMEAEIHLVPEENGVTYQVTTGGNHGSAKVHARGKLIYAIGAEGGVSASPVELNLEEIKARCTRKENASVVYDRIRKGGVIHGNSLQVIEEIMCNGREALAKLVLSKEQEDNLARYLLDPGIMDGALQSATRLIDERTTASITPYLPFAIDELTIFGPLKRVCYVYAARSEDRSGEDNDLMKFDIRITDEQGSLLIDMTRFSMRKLITDGSLPEEQDKAATSKKIQLNDLYRQPAQQPSSQSRRKFRLEEIETRENIKPADKEKSKPGGGRLLDDLKTMLSETLFLEEGEVAVEKNMIELGIDSVLGLEFIQLINRRYGTSLKATTIYEYPTLKRLEGFISSKYKNVIAREPYERGRHDTGEKLIDVKKRLDQGNIAPDSISAKTDKSSALNRSNDIAVIGASCRFSHSENMEELWSHVVNGHYLIGDIPDDRFDIGPWYDADSGASGTIYCKKGSFIEEIDKFDPLFFKMSPREAESMDPQVRLLLEVVWESVEDAGYANGMEGSNTGVFVGNCFTHYYSLLTGQSNPDYQYIISGNGNSILSNRVSYCFDLKGPSLTLDTACASSLVALHLACESLRKGETEQAFVGAASLNLDPHKYLNLCAAGALSKSGKLSPFDESADGFVPGEGVAAVLLKRLTEAERDGDHIYGVIKGTCVRHGGNSGGPTVPNVEMETEVMLEAWNDARIKPETLTYYESHGTGTQLGDPLEMNAFEKAASKLTKKTGFCAVGTVKANIGHTEETAGLAGLINVLLMMKHQTIPALPNLKKLNRMIDLKDATYFIPREKRKWEAIDGVPRRAGISSFGLTGVLAHAVVEEYTQSEVRGEGSASGPADLSPRDEASGEPQIIVLSAMNEDRLKAYAEKLLNALTRNPELRVQNLCDLAYTLQVGRKPMAERLAVVVSGMDVLTDKLGRYVEGETGIDGLYRGNAKTGCDDSDHTGKGQKSEPSINSILQERNFEKLAQLWSQGIQVDWQHLYSDRQHKRISLPTYPFVRDRYWIPANDDQAPSPSAHETAKEIFISSLASNRLAGIDSKKESPIQESTGTLMLHPCWKEQVIVPDGPAKEFAYHLVVFCEPGKVSRESIEAQLRSIQVRFFDMQPERRSVEKRFQAYAAHLFEEIQGIVKGRPDGEVLIQVVVPVEAEGRGQEKSLFSGLSGLLMTTHLENPRIIGQLIEIGSKENQEWIVEKLRENSRSPGDSRVRYQDGKRWITGWKEVEGSPTIPWRDRSTYLITGGAGGLGVIFAKEIARRAKGSNLILAGRTEPNEGIRAIIEEFSAMGGRAAFRQVDVTQGEAVQRLIKSIVRDFGDLNGVIHGAGVVRDNFILKKNKKELLHVLAPKVEGLVNLDLATKGLPLDFLILFSSLAGCLGNAGQADYATANAFMDAYAVYRNVLVACQKRHGQTLSINWPLWKEGGMRIDGETEKTLKRKLGAVPMPTSKGIDTFYRALGSGQHQVMVMEGDIVRMKQNIVFGNIPSRSLSPSGLQQDSRLLKEKTIHHLKRLLGEVIKLDYSGIDADEPLESYGIDSIVITQLNRKLDVIFGALSKTLFFQYRTLSEVADYLASHEPDACMKWGGSESPGFSKPEDASPEHRLNSQFPVPNMVADRLKTDTLRFDSIRDGSKEIREPIAIIGMSGRFPRAETLDRYWENLKSGMSGISEIPEDRWPLAGFFNSDPEEAASAGMSYSKWGGFLDGFAEFDSLFFGISSREALSMDPQERLFLQECWRTFENAGYTRARLAKQHRNRVGVFAGITKTGFELYGPELSNENVLVRRYTSFSSVANRISYLMDLKGPSMPIDTMCSSSLTAIHEACEHLLRGECEVAIAGGVNLYLHPKSYLELCSQHMLSMDGRCKSFGKSSDGFVPGEGVGAVLLKPLSQATTDGDRICAVIRGSGINHGGKTNGYTVPNPTVQGELIREVLNKAGVNARSVSYIEAHGTGTELGDPIEITGLDQAFKEDTQDTAYCAIGSVKSNIGHLEAAAGIAGVIKVLLQMVHKQLVPSLHARELNPNIQFEETPFVVQQGLSQWQRPKVKINGEIQEHPRIAGISSFGAGGSNAHVVIEEYQEEFKIENSKLKNEPQIIVLSAKSEEQLKAYAKAMIDYIAKMDQKEIRNPQSTIRNIAYTLQVGREAMKERLAVIVDSVKGLVSKLKDYIEGKSCMGLYRGKVSRQENFATFSSDAELQEAVYKWMKRGKYERLAEFWVKGLIFEWNRMHDGTKPHCISLPTYPFSGKRYWISEIDTIVRSSIQALPSLQTGSTAASEFNEKNHKPSGISLQNFSESEDANVSGKSLRHKMELSLSDTWYSQPETGEVPEAEPTLQEVFTSDRLQAHLISSLAKALFIEPSEVDVDKKFIDIGLDSIVSIEWIRTINKKYMISIPATRVYDYPTIREFTEFLGEELKKNTSPLSLDALLQNVKQHDLDIEQADLIFKKSILMENPNERRRNL